MKGENFELKNGEWVEMEPIPFHEGAISRIISKIIKVIKKIKEACK